jgi:hypothetical protein
MAVPRIDPRVTKDRIYEYGEYKVLQAQFGRRAAPRSRGGIWIGTDTAPRRRRALSFGLLVGLGLAVMAACAVFAAWLEADSLRLSYKQQDLKMAIAAADQTLAEAVSANLATENKVLADSGAARGVAYPAQTKYVVLTNIPAVSGGKLVDDLYPLSRKLIRIDP